VLKRRNLLREECRTVVRLDRHKLNSMRADSVDIQKDYHIFPMKKLEILELPPSFFIHFRVRFSYGGSREQQAPEDSK